MSFPAVLTAVSPNNLQSPLQILATASITVLIGAGIAGHYFSQQPDPPRHTRARWLRHFDSSFLYLITLFLPGLVFVVSAGLSITYALEVDTNLKFSPQDGLTAYGVAALLLFASTLLIYEEYRSHARRERELTCQIICPSCSLPCPCARPCPCRVRGS